MSDGGAIDLHQPVDNPSAEDTPAEDPPIEEPLQAVVEPPAGAPPVEDPPAEDPPIEEQPPAEDPSVENPPVEDTPTDNPTPEDPPFENPAVENPPVEDPPARDGLVADAPPGNPGARNSSPHKRPPTVVPLPPAAVSPLLGLPPVSSTRNPHMRHALKVVYGPRPPPLLIPPREISPIRGLPPVAETRNPYIRRAVDPPALPPGEKLAWLYPPAPPRHGMGFDPIFMHPLQRKSFIHQLETVNTIQRLRIERRSDDDVFMEPAITGACQRMTRIVAQAVENELRFETPTKFETFVRTADRFEEMVDQHDKILDHPDFPEPHKEEERNKRDMHVYELNKRKHILGLSLRPFCDDLDERRGGLSRKRPE